MRKDIMSLSLIYVKDKTPCELALLVPIKITPQYNFMYFYTHFGERVKERFLVIPHDSCRYPNGPKQDIYIQSN